MNAIQKPDEVQAILEASSETAEKKIVQYIYFTTIKYLNSIHFQFKTYQDEACSDKFNMYLGIHRDKLASLAGKIKVKGKQYRVPYLPIIEKLVKAEVIVDPDKFGFNPGTNSKKYLLPYQKVKTICGRYWKRVYQPELDINSTFYLEAADFIKKENENKLHYGLKSYNLNRKPIHRERKAIVKKVSDEDRKVQIACRDWMRQYFDNGLAMGRFSQKIAQDMSRLGGFVLERKGYTDATCDPTDLRAICMFIIKNHKYIPNAKAMLQNQKFDFCRQELIASYKEQRAS